VSDQTPERLDDQRDATLDLMYGVSMDRVQCRRDPQLRQRFLSGPPSVLQKLAEFPHAAPAAGLRYV